MVRASAASCKGGDSIQSVSALSICPLLHGQRPVAGSPGPLLVAGAPHTDFGWARPGCHRSSAGWCRPMSHPGPALEGPIRLGASGQAAGSPPRQSRYGRTAPTRTRGGHDAGGPAGDPGHSAPGRAGESIHGSAVNHGPVRGPGPGRCCTTRPSGGRGGGRTEYGTERAARARWARADTTRNVTE